MVKYKVTIGYDECTDNPLTWDSYAFVRFACAHKRYDLGNATMDDLLTQYHYFGDKYDLSAIVDHLSQYGYVDTLSMTDHSGLTVRRGCPFDRWDSGYIGVVFVDKADFVYFGRSDVGKCIDGMIDDYNQYLNGEIYGYRVEKYTSEGMEYVYGCGGYYSIDDVKNDCIQCIPDEYRDNIEWTGII